MPRRAYPSDLTDAQWAAIAPMIPDATPGGRPRKADKREIMDAILYILGGCAWRRIATRYDRCAHIFMSAICIAATVIFCYES